MKNILIYNDHWLVGGAESLWVNILQNINKENLSFRILVTQKESNTFDKILEDNNIPIDKILEKKIKNPILRTRTTLKKFKKIIKNYNPDILHLNSSNASCFKLACYAKKAGIKNVIVHSHNTNIEHDRFHIKRFAHNHWKKKYIKYVDYKFGCSTESLEFMFNSKDGIIVKNGVNLKLFHYDESFRNEIRKKYNISEKNTLLGHVGRFSRQKNHAGLIKIFYEYQKNNPNSTLMLIGEGELEGEIIKMCSDLKIEDKVIFAGISNEIYKYLSAFDIFLLPSLHEGLPVSAIEAQAVGLPSILSDKISPEVKITNNCCLNSLDDIDLWCKTIDVYRNIKHQNTEKEIKDSGFDISQTAIMLESFYNKI